jgi:MFS family permease
MLACFCSGVGGASIMAVWSELLLGRACGRLNIPFPSQACDQHPDAQTEATLRQTYMQLAQSIPAALTVGMVSSIADSRGRRLAMITSFISTLMFCVAVLVVPDRVPFAWALGPDEADLDGYWVILGISLVTSFTGGNTATFSSAMSVIADVSQGWTAVQRTNLFMMLEAALWGGGIVGPILGSSVAKIVGLQKTFLFAVLMISLGIVLLLCFYRETLRDSEREAFTWSRANPVSAMGPLFSHPGKKNGR